MVWLWVLLALVVLIGGIKLAILPEQRRRRGLADINADGGGGMSGDDRISRGSALDVSTTDTIGPNGIQMRQP